MLSHGPGLWRLLGKVHVKVIGGKATIGGGRRRDGVGSGLTSGPWKIPAPRMGHTC